MILINQTGTKPVNHKTNSTSTDKAQRQRQRPQHIYQQHPRRSPTSCTVLQQHQKRKQYASNERPWYRPEFPLFYTGTAVLQSVLSYLSIDGPFCLGINQVKYGRLRFIFVNNIAVHFLRIFSSVIKQKHSMGQDTTVVVRVRAPLIYIMLPSREH